MLPDITTQKVAIPASLFLALSSGILLRTDGSRIAFRDGLTGRTAAALFHALVFFSHSLLLRRRWVSSLPRRIFS